MGRSVGIHIGPASHGSEEAGEHPAVGVGDLDEGQDQVPVKVSLPLPALPIVKPAVQPDIDRIVDLVVPGQVNLGASRIKRRFV